MIRVFALAAALTASAVTAIAATPGDDQPAVQVRQLAVVEHDLRRARLYADRLERVVRRQVNRAERNERRLRAKKLELQRAVAHHPSVHRIIAVAATAYGQSYSTLLRKAECESHLWPFARNRSSGASGLFQFLPSTWRSTPFGRHSIWDPFAQALAASYMHAHLRGNEWVCR